MNILEHPFIILQFIGLWRPINWESGWKRFFYDSYTWFIIIFVSLLVLSEFIELGRSIDDLEAFTGNSFVALTMVGVCGKAVNVLSKREQIIELMNAIENDPCRARDEQEVEIREKFKRLARLNTLSYASMTLIGGICVQILPAIPKITNKELLFNAWTPYDTTSSWGYWFANFHQTFSHFAGAGLNVVFDTVVPGFMIQISGQLNILKYRFQQMPKILSDKENQFDQNLKKIEMTILADRVEHHLQIFKISNWMNSIFSSTIFLQYSLNSMILCATVFELSRLQPFSTEFTGMVMYILCMSTQIFIFCFFGHQTTFESIIVGDAIFEMDWLALTKSTKKCLMMIMSRTLRPIKFSSASLLTLNIDSFSSLLKLSYSAYTMLQQTSEK